MLASKKIVFIAAALLLSVACQRKNCPTYWANSDTVGGQTASDGKKSSGENLNETESGSREQEFPMVRVKRDKNGIITKKAMSRNKVKRTDPRKSYKPR
jgi:hypothetical protein